jgi:hypothetical protein
MPWPQRAATRWGRYVEALTQLVRTSE